MAEENGIVPFVKPEKELTQQEKEALFIDELIQGLCDVRNLSLEEGVAMIDITNKINKILDDAGIELEPTDF